MPLSREALDQVRTNPELRFNFDGSISTKQIEMINQLVRLFSAHRCFNRNLSRRASSLESVSNILCPPSIFRRMSRIKSMSRFIEMSPDPENPRSRNT